MKLLPSSTSSSSTSSSSCSSSFAFSSSTPSEGCISAVLRRILCSRTLPPHPLDSSDHNTRRLNPQETKRPHSAPPTPGIVARLMGLDTLPEPIDARVSVSRCRSLSHLDCREIAEDETLQHHRRLRSTASFRETPTYLRIENEEFLVLSFEDESEVQEAKQRRLCRRKTKESRMDKAFERENCVNKEFSERNSSVAHEAERERVLDSSLSCEKASSTTTGAFDQGEELNCQAVMTGMGQTQNVCSGGGASDLAKLRSVKKKHKRTNRSGAVPLESEECSSEDSSPVSVLDFREFVGDPEASTSDDSSGLERPSSRKKLAQDLEDEDEDHPCPRSDSDLIHDHNPDRITNRASKNQRKQNYSDLWSEICEMSDREMAEQGSNWFDRRSKPKKLGDCKGITVIVEQLELQIFYGLLDELLDQLLIM